MKAAISILLVTTVVLLPALHFAGQRADGYEITWSTVDGGGTMVAAGGGYELSGTIGQSDAGMSPCSAYMLTGGFWAFIATEQGEMFLGDLNCDGVVDVNDIAPFVLALTDPDNYTMQYQECCINLADMNEDESVNGSDIQGFVGLLLP